MVINIANDSIGYLSEIFKYRPSQFNEYARNGECITVVDGYKIVAEIKPWNIVVNDSPTHNTYLKWKHKNQFDWLPFSVMVNRGLATLFDDRYDSYSGGKIRVTKL
jgi:hypothetical protein